ncbi:hypothetical protein MA16_Dca023119 [Dendrobium catenatum]|uniref:Uncharacterized protein n=1 Tax=Dendrobium catenatum TaxID=906689 RepID=A0A2I0WYH0_9ASPA|nr:hypothetical protein MA16_Dca023119 [Dendrobium catenatum]
MVAEDCWSPAVPMMTSSPLKEKNGHCFEDSLRNGSNLVTVAEGRERNISTGIVIKDHVEIVPKVSLQVEVKGKGISCNYDCKTPNSDKAFENSLSKLCENQASSFSLKIFVNRFGNSNAILGNGAINANSLSSVTKKYSKFGEW